MAEANSHYYAHNVSFGEQGDFYTSPEITPLFGELIGLSFVDIWVKMGSPTDFSLVELGPGKGTLMSDILRVGSRYWGTPKIHLVENSERLSKVQAETLQGCDVSWHECFDNIKLDKPFLLVANEFFDALPVRHLRRKEGEWEEKYVEAGEEIWRHCEEHGDEVISEQLDCSDGHQCPPRNDVMEISPLTTTIFTQIADALKVQAGYALIIDYGYLQNLEDFTAQACKGNKRVSIYETPGETDISAYVDFGNLERQMQASGLKCYGPVTQAQYLTQLGLPERLKQVIAKAQNPHTYLRQARILVDPSAMGAIFKVMGVGSQDFGELPGFLEETACTM